MAGEFLSGFSNAFFPLTQQALFSQLARKQSVQDAINTLGVNTALQTGDLSDLRSALGSFAGISNLQAPRALPVTQSSFVSPALNVASLGAAQPLALSGGISPAIQRQEVHFSARPRCFL